jgi:polyphenol oxidase
MILATSLSGLPGIRHAFFDRSGGVSKDLFASLNCGYGSADAPDNVRENRRLAAGHFGHPEERLLTLHQIHSTIVLTVDDDLWRSPGAPQADAMVTRRRDVVLGVLAADCAPVLLADARAGVIGAAHAGWRGALSGVVECTVEAMETLGADRSQIHAAVGPCIGGASYEVGPEFPPMFVAQDVGNGRFFRASPRVGHHLFDLAGYLVHRLGLLGIPHRTATGHDTLAEEARFFSYRRNTLRGIRDYGRGLSAIALDPV